MDQEQLLRDLRPWILKVAWSMTSDPGTVQDLAQEGWIAAYRAAVKSNRNHISFAKQAATWRMKEVARDRPTFGANPRGRGSVGTPTPVDVIPEIGLLENYVELAYHDNEISQAIETLPRRQREYVRLRFWAGLNTSELKAHFGYHTWDLWSPAKEKLATKLNHLRDEKV